MNDRSKPLQWDIFCKVIDNFGDVGVCWRLSADLASRGHRVRLWLDDARALAWLAPEGPAEGVEVLAGSEPLQFNQAELTARPGDVWVEAFGCNFATEIIANYAINTVTRGLKPHFFNLEYLSAEPYAARNHALPSPVRSGPAAGWTKWFFYPGFTAQTGGLLRENDLADRQQAFEPDRWLALHGIEKSEHPPGALLISLFCYEPPDLADLLRQWAAAGHDGRPVRLLVTAGRATRAVSRALQAHKISTGSAPAAASNPSLLHISYLPLLSQRDYDHLLWACDINFVRGEDSLVRAIWAGKPLVWHIYPQDDNAHHAKLEAFLEVMGAPTSLRAFHRRWNGLLTEPGEPTTVFSLPDDLQNWQQTAAVARQTQLALPDLTNKLLQFIEKNR